MASSSEIGAFPFLDDGEIGESRVRVSLFKRLLGEQESGVSMAGISE